MGPTQRENEILSQKNAYISCTMLCCDRVFSTMMNLKQHMMYHAGIMPFMCSECGLAFKTQVGIDKHFETNHGGESVNNSKKLRGFTICNVCSARIPIKEKKDHIKLHIPV